MPTVLITGANRGIGLEFAKQYAAEGWRVHAACRDPDMASALKAIKGDIRLHRLEVTDEAQIDALAKSLGSESLDIVINNAGIIGPDDSFGKTDVEGWMQTLRVNAVAPVRIAERLVANLERGERKLLVNITSRMGSIADNSSGGSYAYRTSKAALNMAAKSLSLDLKRKGITVVVFHPGWAKTDMGGRSATVPVADSVGGMRAKIAALTAADSGQFFNYNGQPVPW
ncbi:MAG TPA: SDR family oxidoreductase [Dongiaceae bacterium]|jgi:NAD(P)-dependent dehydrogenase (short-subunit alcohol dehydrogenase family)